MALARDGGQAARAWWHEHGEDVAAGSGMPLLSGA